MPQQRVRGGRVRVAVGRLAAGRRGICVPLLGGYAGAAPGDGRTPLPAGTGAGGDGAGRRRRAGRLVSGGERGRMWLTGRPIAEDLCVAQHQVASVTYWGWKRLMEFRGIKWFFIFLYYTMVLVVFVHGDSEL